MGGARLPPAEAVLSDPSSWFGRDLDLSLFAIGGMAFLLFLRLKRALTTLEGAHPRCEPGPEPTRHRRVASFQPNVGLAIPRLVPRFGGSVFEMTMLNDLSCLLAFSPPPQPGQKPPPIWVTLAPILFMVVIMYWIMIRPQQKEQKRRDAMIKALKKGDRVVTSSGIVAVVVTIKEKSITLRSDEAKFEVLKSAVTDVTEVASEPAKP